MIITKFRNFKEIEPLLSKDESIDIVSCNTCARVCKTGGQEGMEKVAKKLKDKEYKVDKMNLVPACCSVKLLKRFNYKSKTLIILACDAGTAALKHLFPKKKVICHLETIENGFHTEKGEFISVNHLSQVK